MRTLRRYDHRLRDLVHSTGDSSIAHRLGVPRSTAFGWVKHPPKQVLSLVARNTGIEELELEIQKLRGQVLKLRWLLRILFVFIKVAVTGRIVVAVPAAFGPNWYCSSNHLLLRQFGQPAATRNPPPQPAHLSYTS
jgi:hypothetical protein